MQCRTLTFYMRKLQGCLRTGPVFKWVNEVKEVFNIHVLLFKTRPKKKGFKVWHPGSNCTSAMDFYYYYYYFCYFIHWIIQSGASTPWAKYLICCGVRRNSDLNHELGLPVHQLKSNAFAFHWKASKPFFYWFSGFKGWCFFGKLWRVRHTKLP